MRRWESSSMNSARLVPAISAAFDWEISPCEYHSNAAATRISLTNSVGDKRSAESAPSGTSNVIVGIGCGLSQHQDTAVVTECKQGGCTETGRRSAPRGSTDCQPIVSRELKRWLRGGFEPPTFG